MVCCTAIVLTHAHKYLVRDSCSMLLFSVRHSADTFHIGYSFGFVSLPVIRLPSPHPLQLVLYNLICCSFFCCCLVSFAAYHSVVRYLCACSRPKTIRFKCRHCMHPLNVHAHRQTPATSRHRAQKMSRKKNEQKIIEATNTKRHLYQLSCHCKSLRFAEAHQPSIFETRDQLLFIE